MNIKQKMQAIERMRKKGAIDTLESIFNIYKNYINQVALSGSKNIVR